MQEKYSAHFQVCPSHRRFNEELNCEQAEKNERNLYLIRRRSEKVKKAKGKDVYGSSGQVLFLWAENCVPLSFFSHLQ